MGNKKVCGKCGGMVESRGFAVHEAFCKGEKKEETKTVESEISTMKCHKCQSDKTQRLDEFLLEHQNYKAHVQTCVNGGYTHICLKCAEVLK